MPSRWEQRGRQTRRELDRQRRDEEKSALTGKVRSDGSLTLRGDSATGDLLPTNKVYVRVDGLQSDTREVWAANVGWTLNMWVVIKPDGRGRWTAIRLDDEATTATHGEQARDFASPASTGARPDLINGRGLLPGRLFLAEAGTLKVNVSDFWYLDSAGALKKWTAVIDASSPDNNSLALTAPSASGGIDQKRKTLVTFNPDATSPALVATNGTAKHFTYELTDADIEAIAFPDGHLSIAAVELATGDTTLVETDITDTRFHVGGGATGTGGAAGEYMLDDDGALMLDDDGHIMRDDG